MQSSALLSAFDPIRISRYLRREFVETIVFVVRIFLYILLTALLVWLLAQVFTTVIDLKADKSTISNMFAQAKQPSQKTGPALPATNYQSLTSNNLFGSLTPKTDSSAAPPKPLSTLALNLIGTFISSGSTPYAIIEDDKKKIQDVFNVNDLIFNDAKLKSIFSDRVEIERNGKIEVLSLDQAPDAGGGPSGGGGVTEAGSDEFVVDEAELNQALENLNVLLTQARAVPYFKDGRSIGLRLFAIRTGSLYEKLGLKNGDILKSINGQSLANITEAMKLFEKLKEERSVNLVLERDRGDREFKYQIR